MFAAVSYRYSNIINGLNSLGIRTIEVPAFNGMTQNYESSHADMQVLCVKETLFLLKDNDIFNNKVIEKTGLDVVFTSECISEFKYPECVKLNAAVVEKNIIANYKYMDKKILEKCKDYNIITVAQGYAKCSSAIISDKAVITSDESIYNACTKKKIDCLKIQSGYIQLCERYGGFIGGSCFQFDDTLYFTGDIKQHPDYSSIKSFCLNYSVNIKSIVKHTLTDVGGIVII